MDPADRRHAGNGRERRRGPDPLLRSLRWLGGLGWLSMMAALFFLDRAKPEIETFFDRWYNLSLRTSWNMELARFILYCMIAGLLLSLAGLIINFKRHRRRGDEVRISLVLLGTLSLFGIICYFMVF